MAMAMAMVIVIVMVMVMCMVINIHTILMSECAEVGVNGFTVVDFHLKKIIILG